MLRRASIRKGADDQTRDYATSTLAYITGRISNRGDVDSFLHPEEDKDQMADIKRLYGEQPALFQPRENWSHWKADNPQYPGLSDPDTLIRSTYGPQDWKNDMFPPDGWRSSWENHISELWCLWKDIHARKMLRNAGLLELLPILRYGISDVVGVANDQVLIMSTDVHVNKDLEEAKGSAFFGRSPFLSPDQEKVRCNSKMGFYTPLEFREAMYHKRFFAGFINFASHKHFTTFIFDRLKGHFAHFDTYEEGQGKRMTAAVLAFREALAWAGLPFDFDYTGFPLSPQPGAWECGILSFFSLFMCLRGLVGIDAGQLSDIYTAAHAPVDGEELGQREPFELLFRDWILDTRKPGGVNYELGLRRIAAWFQGVIMQEIGVPKGKYLDKQLKLRESPGHRLVACRELRYRPPDYAIEDLYTEFGGYQPITFVGVQCAKEWQHHRLLSLPRGTLRGNYRREGSRSRLYSLCQTTSMPAHVFEWYKSLGLKIKGDCPVKEGHVSDGGEISDDSPRSLTPEAVTHRVGEDTLTVAIPVPRTTIQRSSPEPAILPPPTPLETAESLLRALDLGAHTKTITKGGQSEMASQWSPTHSSSDTRMASSPRSPPSPAPESQEGLPTSSFGIPARPGISTPACPYQHTPRGATNLQPSSRMHTQRAALTDFGPVIRDATAIECHGIASNDYKGGKCKIGKGTRVMSLEAVKTYNFSPAPGQVTYELSTKTYVTHVPAGLIPEDQWSKIVEEAARPFLPKAFQVESREERLERRRAKRDAKS